MTQIDLGAVLARGAAGAELQPEPEPELQDNGAGAPGAVDTGEVATLVVKAVSLLNEAQQLADDFDSRAHCQAALSLFDAALELDPESLSAEMGRTQALKGVNWNTIESERSASSRRNAHRETRMRGSRFLGQGGGATD
jgi:hypothetical protein